MEKKGETMNNKNPADSLVPLSGNILLFYAFDIGDDIDLATIDKKGLVPTHTVPLSAYFKNYHIPLSFYLQRPEDTKQPEKSASDCVTSKIHNFGVLSFCYRIPFKASIEQLKLEVIETKQLYDKKSAEDAREVFEKIKVAIEHPLFYNLANSYFAVQVNPTTVAMQSGEFQEKYAGKIASLLRLETKTLSEYQKEEILASIHGYYGQDFIIIDQEGAFVYDDEYFEQMEFFESTNVQLLELQYFDRLLDEKLNVFYKQAYFKIPFSSYIPLLGRKLESPISRLAKLRVDISVVTERLENSIKLAGDSYYTKVYSLLRERLSLKEWHDSIQKKLDIIQDLYRVHQDRLDIIHGEILEVVIIILIALELILPILGK